MAFFLLNFHTIMATLFDHLLRCWFVFFCRKWQAIGAQFATATAAFAGTAFGLLATKYAGLEQPLLAATAGGFVYVSCVAVMPDVLNGSPSCLQATAEVAAMCAGIALMVGVALLE